MKTKRLTYLAMFVALGVLIPQVFHMIGGPLIGSILLPMHIPVLVGAMILGPRNGAIIGVTSVIIGAILGMPAMPMAIFMFFELLTYGVVAGYIFGRINNCFVALVCAMISGRIVSLSVMLICIHIIGMKLPPIFGTIAFFSTGIPGMIGQIVLVPVLVSVLRRGDLKFDETTV
ncbi:MAG: ECF transporter S component [Clostridiales bacterium]|nr:ECF transporter S component [Clostridiales bacterium]